jgi:predicted RNA binding protein YcfA (HicA-like mRNA interferase family)
MRRWRVDAFDSAHYRSVMKVRDMLKMLHNDGWHLDDLPPGTLNSILKQAGLKTTGD